MRSIPPSAILRRSTRVLLWRRARAFVRAEALAPLMLAVFVGFVIGIGVATVRLLVQNLHETLFGIGAGENLSSARTHIEPLRLVLVTTLGGLAVGLLNWAVRRLRRREAIDPIEANALYGGRMSLTDSSLLTLGTILSSGFGASVGLEAGYTQLGSGFASRLGRSFSLRRADLRTMVACGAAGAIAAAFNAPLAGAFYAFELVLGAYTVMALAPVVLAALVANVVAEFLFPGGAFRLDRALTFANHDYPVFILLGLMAGGLGILMMQMSTTVEVLLKRARIPPLLRPPLGGFVVGVLACYSPAVLSAGHGAVHDFLVQNHSLTLLVILLAAKLIAAAASVGSGFRGGLFFTSLFTGVVFGNIGGIAFALVAPDYASERLVYALVGMASVAAAVIGAPMTMIFLVLELTGSLAMAGGVMLAVVTSSELVRRLFGYSFATWRLHLRGETIRSAFDVGWARDLTVVRMMRREARTVGDAMTVAAFRKRFPIGSTERVFLIDEAERYVGMVLVAEAHAPDLDDRADSTGVRDLRHAPAVFLLPRQTVDKALQAFEAAEVEALPVVDDPQSRRVLGYVSEAYVLKRYSQELERRRREYAGET